MARHYLRKKIFLNKKHTKFCWVKLYAEKGDMCSDYGSDEILGAHKAYTNILVDGGNKPIKCGDETGTVFLCMQHCGAGVVSHEFLHAVLWAHKHSIRKKQHPIIIKDMDEEEIILHNHSEAVMQFYRWYWKVEKRFEKK